MTDLSRRLRIAALAATIAAGLAFGLPAAAQQGDWPSRPIKLVIPFATGGATDIVGRLAGQSLSRELGQPVVPDNRTGAGGTIGAAAVAKAPPDGYTLGMATVSTHVTNPVLMQLAYDPDKDLVPIVQIAAVPFVLVVHPGVPAKTFQEFIALLKANPDKYNYSSAGTGGINQITCETLLSATGTAMTHVPYKGAGAALSDLLGGQVQASCDQTSSTLTHIQAGKLKALAVAAPARLPSIPDVPTFLELGYPELNSMAWYGLMAPGSTPQPIIDRLNTTMNRIIQTREFREALDATNSIPLGGTQAEFQKAIASEIERVRAVVKARGIKLN